MNEDGGAKGIVRGGFDGITIGVAFARLGTYDGG